MNSHDADTNPRERDVATSPRSRVRKRLVRIDILRDTFHSGDGDELLEAIRDNLCLPWRDCFAVRWLEIFATKTTFEVLWSPDPSSLAAFADILTAEELIHILKYKSSPLLGLPKADGQAENSLRVFRVAFSCGLSEKVRIISPSRSNPKGAIRVSLVGNNHSNPDLHATWRADTQATKGDGTDGGAPKIDGRASASQVINVPAIDVKVEALAESLIGIYGSAPRSADSSYATAFSHSPASYHTAWGVSLRSPTSWTSPSSAGMPGSLTPWKRFLKERELLPSAFEEQNSSGRGQHAEYSKTEVEKVPLERCGQILGHSANALVEVVKCKRITLARKTIRCGRRMRREDAAKEVEHLQRLNHAHIVRVVGTYVFEHSRNLQILIYPVADCDLETYMETDFDRDVLVRFFGCLAHTIEYLHKKLIKHMDIKPKNILVRYRYGSYEQAPKIYLADFGIARSYESALDAETCSPTAYTRTYAAPEVVAQETRGFKADIFSLGCVFAEMLCALAYRSDELIGILQENIEDKSFQANIETVQYLVNSLRDQDLIHLGADLAIFNCHRMLHRDPDMRPPANIVLHYLPHHQCCIAMSDRLEVSSDYQ